MDIKIAKGQRWYSSSEPELGLGCVDSWDERTIKIIFPAGDITRCYALENNPLKRAHFVEGNLIEDKNGKKFKVETFIIRDGLYIYQGNGLEINELELKDDLSIEEPFERLIKGESDSPEVVFLRSSTMNFKEKYDSSNVAGLLGGKIDLHSHQLFIAEEVCNRVKPRVLLSDEVGLGKTIEACLIINRLLKTNQAYRILILVPESLMHQWFIELLKKFAIKFCLVDKSFCESKDNISNTPLALSSIDILKEDPSLMNDFTSVEWDLVIIDEAHHAIDSIQNCKLKDSLQKLAKNALILLTATPLQSGVKNHFEQLSLIDEERYFSYDIFLKEQKNYEKVGDLAKVILKGDKIEEKDLSFIFKDKEEDTHFKQLVKSYNKGTLKSIDEIIRPLVDYYGIGRNIFRNTRKAIKNFPHRRPYFINLGPLPIHQEKSFQDELRHDISDDFLEPNYDLRDDKRVDWLANFIKKTEEKLLLICRTPKKACAILKALETKINVKTALFIENLSLLERDRQAAWFSDDEGAQILIASEIGSEGRNFQFSSKLILFDLPLNPELLEQRIGRLDRLGQKKEIQIYFPYFTDSTQEFLKDWYHIGMEAFNYSNSIGFNLFKEFGPPIKNLITKEKALKSNANECKSLIKKTKNMAIQEREIHKKGRNFLLELSSHNQNTGQQIISQIKATQLEDKLETFMNSMFDHFGVNFEKIDHRTYHLSPELFFNELFHIFKKETLTITYDRDLAVKHDSWEFLTWDHPMVEKSIDLLLSSKDGNACFFEVENWKEDKIYLEGTYVFECLSGYEYHVGRFAPNKHFTIAVDHDFKIQENSIFNLFNTEHLSEITAEKSTLYLESLKDILPKMLEFCKQNIEPCINTHRKKKIREIDLYLENEILRYEMLKKRNSHVRSEELDFTIQMKDKLTEALQKGRIRLDSVRLILCRS